MTLNKYAGGRQFIEFLPASRSGNCLVPLVRLDRINTAYFKLGGLGFWGNSNTPLDTDTCIHFLKGKYNLVQKIASVEAVTRKLDYCEK